MYRNIAVIGASGAIGCALVKLLACSYNHATIHAFSRYHTVPSEPYSFTNVQYHGMDYQDELSIQAAAMSTITMGPLDLVIVTTGILHQADMMPEKSMAEISAQKFRLLFEANTILPALLIKHFSPLLNTEHATKFAVLSARVGSINDNKIGGWYAYRASKAALNMIVKNAAIELHRKNKKALIIGLHPGTVDSALSVPFQRNVPEGKLFTPDYASEMLLKVINFVTIEQSGQCFAWDGKPIEA